MDRPIEDHNRRYLVNIIKIYILKKNAQVQNFTSLKSIFSVLFNRKHDLNKPLHKSFVMYNSLYFTLPLVCPVGFFGQECAYRCNNTCKGCNNTNGLCDSGCSPGWKGDYCNEGIVLQNRRKGFLCLNCFIYINYNEPSVFCNRCIIIQVLKTSFT